MLCQISKDLLIQQNDCYTNYHIVTLTIPKRDMCWFNTSYKVLINKPFVGSTNPFLQCNQCIERLWVDVYLGVVYIYYCVFIYLEMEQLLHVDNEVEMFCLHYVYKQKINDHLKQFTEGWNCHKLSCMHNLTPNQLWIMSMHDMADKNPRVAREIWEPSTDVSIFQ